MKNNYKKLLFAFAILAFVVIARLIPHLSNFTPIFAFGILLVPIFKNRLFTLALPLTAMIVSDIFIGFYPEIWAVYISLIISMVIAHSIAQRLTPGRVVFSSIAAPTVFYILSNLAVWKAWYSADINGLTLCYLNAIPFYGYSLTSTLVYSFVFIGLYHISTHEKVLLSVNK